jgi:hypothetical protein
MRSIVDLFLRNPQRCFPVISWAYGVNFHIIMINECMYSVDESCTFQ